MSRKKRPAAAEDAPRLPETIPREQFERWMDGLVSEITAGGSLGFGAENKAWNDATMRAAGVAKSYKVGRGIFQYEDLKR